MDYGVAVQAADLVYRVEATERLLDDLSTIFNNNDYEDKCPEAVRILMAAEERIRNSVIGDYKQQISDL